MANLAGIGYSLGLTMDDLQCSISGYNDGISAFVKEVLNSVQNFEITKDFFEIKKALVIR